MFEARDRRTGRRVAVKLLSADEPALLAGLRREIEALSILRHPGVVEVLDHGLQEGLPWYAMELIEGDPLRRRMAGLPLSTLLDTLARLCEALAFIHAEGFVHRDLNPDNIVLRADGTPVLIDFGLATKSPGASHREHLAAGDDPGGRLAYMAPEQIRGDLVDGRADLYALGCVLYEGLAGRVPFVGSARQVLRNHLETPPPPLPLSARCREPLARLVAGLLQKDPRDRPAYAGQVLRLLGEARAEEPGPHRSSPRQPSGQRIYLNRPAWVGRAAELERVERWIERALRGQGAVGVIFGESGMGKTRLVLETASRIRERGAVVFAGGGRAHAAGLGAASGSGAVLAPLRPVLASVARHCREAGPVEIERLCAAGLGLLAPFNRDLAELVGEPAAPARAASPRAYRRALFDALTGVLCALADRGPVLLIVDDMQWSDDLTAEWITALVRDPRLGRSRVLVLLCARSEEVDPTLDAILRGPGLDALVLAPLPGEDIARMLHDTLRTALRDPSGLSAVVERAAGNPFFASEYLSLVVTEASPDQVGDRPFDLDLSQLAVPPSISALLERRLGRLDAPTRELAELAAVLGRELPEHWLEQAAAGAAPRAVQQMLRLRILETSGRSLRFVHDRIRETLLQALPPDQGRSLSLRAAAILERELALSSFAHERSRFYPSLARHLQIGGEAARAVRYFALAAEEARATFSNAEVVEFLGAAVQHADDAGVPPARKALWLRQLGEANSALGRANRGRAHMREALALLGRPFPVTRRGLAAGLALEIGRQSLQRLLAPVLEPAARAVDEEARARWTEAARCHEGIGYLLSDRLAALYTGIAALNLAERADAGAELERGYASMAVVMGMVGWSGAADAYFQLSRRVGDRANQAESRIWALTLEAYHGISHGQLDRARPAARAGADLALRVGEHRRHEDCLSLLSEIAVFEAQDAAAFAHADALAASARRRGDRQTELWAATNHARMSLVRGDVAAARDRLASVDPDEQRSTATDFIMLRGLQALARWRCGEHPDGISLACHTVELAAAADPTFFFGLHGLWPAVDVLLEAHPTAPNLRPPLDTGIRLLRQLSRLHPIARPRYWLAEGKRRRLLGLPSAPLAFARAEEHARRLGLPIEQHLAHQALDL